MSEILVGYGPQVRLLPGECWSHQHPFNYVLNILEGRIGLKIDTSPGGKIIERPESHICIPGETEHTIANLSHQPLQLSCDENGLCTIRYLPAVN